MSKPAAIILLVILALLLVGLLKILLPSIRTYIRRMPKGIFVLLFLAVAGTVVYLIYFLITDTTGGINGNESNDMQTEVIAENDIPQTNKENCVVLYGADIYIENTKAEITELEKYLDYRVNNNIPVTIVDDYATLALFNNVKAVCDKKGVRYSIEDEEWLK